jgi:flagellar biosynthesis protein FlhF
LFLLIPKRGKMKIRKYRARNFQEGKDKIIAELGPEAIILSTRVIPPSPPEMEEMVELVAALDTEDTKDEKYFKETKPSIEKPEYSKSDLIEFSSSIYKELVSLKNLIWNFYEKINYTFISHLPPDIAELSKLMLKNGFSTDFTLSFVQSLKENKYIDFEELRQTAIQILADKITYASAIEKSNVQQILIFIGPTGCGKTLNIIKLGVLFKILLNAKVNVISCDYRKIGGWEQLQILSAISNLPSFYCQSNAELGEYLKNIGSYDFLLIDTSGGSPKDESLISELEELVGLATPSKKILVLSVANDKMNFKENLKGFGKLKPDYLLLTKFDEVDTIGHIYEPLLEISSQIKPIYFSSSPDIPYGIEPAGSEFLKKFLINYVE